MTTAKAKSPRRQQHPEYGLTSEQRANRTFSIGASDTRVICCGKDEDIERLWMEKCDLLSQAEKAKRDADMADNIFAQFGHFLEPFHRDWITRRTDLTISRVGECVTGEGEHLGLHATLDGFIEALPAEEFPSAQGFDWGWICGKPRGTVRAPIELKFRNSAQFDDEEQVATFMPQVHQHMALTNTMYGVLSTFTSNCAIKARVMRFDAPYWADCMHRVRAFRSSVSTRTRPLQFPPLEAVNLTKQKTVLKTVDMTAPGSRYGNFWTAMASMFITTLPDEQETRRMSDHDKAKAELKKLISKDVGTAKGAGLEIRRMSDKLHVWVENPDGTFSKRA